MVCLAGTVILRPLPGEGERLIPGAYSLQQQLLEAVRYDIYKLKAYKLRRIRKDVRLHIESLERL